MLVLVSARSQFMLSLFFTIGYFFVISAGAEAYSRFKVPVMPMYALLIGGGAAGTLQRIQRFRAPRGFRCIQSQLSPSYCHSPDAEPIRRFRYWKAVGCDHSFDPPAGAGIVLRLPSNAWRIACFSNGIALAICNSGYVEKLSASVRLDDRLCNNVSRIDSFVNLVDRYAEMIRVATS